MSRSELPARAANILRAIQDGDSCDSAVVESLKLLLLPQAAANKKVAATSNQVRSRSTISAASRSKATTTRGKKQPEVEVLACGETESYDILKPQERLFAATEVVNGTLKALTIAIKTGRTPQTPVPKSKVQARSTSPATKPNSGTPSQVQTPLQQICVNRVLQSPSKSKKLRRTSSELSKDSSCLRAQAECSRIGLACLRSLQSLEAFKTKFAPLQLENGMSALIAKLLMLGYDDLALNELRILRKRIEVLTPDLNGALSKAPRDAREKSANSATTVQKETLSDLLKYNTSRLPGPLLNLVIMSQIQVLKILAIKGHGPSTEAAVKHLRIDTDYSPLKLIERQIDLMDAKNKINAAHQMESLAHTILRLCPSASKIDDEQSRTRSYPSAQVALELQSLSLQTRVRWWELSNHKPNINHEVLGPFARYLDAFGRRCALQSSEKYCMGKNAFNSISGALRSWDGLSQSASLPIFRLLANQAHGADRNDEAIMWTEKGLTVTEAVDGSNLQRSAFLCRLATYRLRGRGLNTDDSQILASLRNAITSIEGDLSGESYDLDELLLAVGELRKVAFSHVHDNAKSLEPSQISDRTSFLGQCVRTILLSIRFVTRYVGREPASDAVESKLSRYNQRKSMAKRMLPSITSSVIAVSRWFLTSSMDEWQRFDTVFQDVLELSAQLETGSESLQESSNSADSPSPHISVSSIYWLRFITQKKMSAEPKVFLRFVTKSVDLLENRSNDEKTQGSFVMKAEKCASLYETFQDYSTSAKYYRKAMEFLIDNGGIASFAEAARSITWQSAVARNCEFEQMTRPFYAFPKVMLTTNPQGSGSRIYFDAEWLPNNQRGLILELQLISLISLLLDRGSPPTIWEELQFLCQRIFSTYSKDCFLAQRLYVCVHILHLQATLPMTPENGSLSKMVAGVEGQLQDSAAACEGSSVPYVRHLASCVDLYRVLREDTDSSTIEPILVNWWSLVQRCPDPQVLTKHVYDTSGWLQQLELVSEHSFTRGYESIRTSVLNLIVSIQEKVSSMKCMDLASGLMNLGIHYAKLGYSGHGGYNLQKAKRILDVSELPPEFMLQWWLTNADYSLLCCNIENWYVIMCKFGVSLAYHLQ